MREHTPLAKPGFCSGRRISCKPDNGALLSISIKNNGDSRIPYRSALCGTSISSNSDSQRISAGMNTSTDKNISAITSSNNISVKIGTFIA